MEALISLLAQLRPLTKRDASHEKDAEHKTGAANPPEIL